VPAPESSPEAPPPSSPGAPPPSSPGAPPPTARLASTIAWGDAPPRFGTTARRVALAIVITAVLPFLAALAVGKLTIDRLGALAVQPELGVALDRALGVYADLAASLKESMRHEAAAMAATPALVAATATAPDAAVLATIAREHPRAASIAIESPDGETLASHVVRATSAPDVKRLTVRSPIPGTTSQLVAVLETPGARFAEQEQLATFERAYRELESTRRSAYVERPYLVALTLVMALTIALALVVAAIVTRPVTRGVQRLTEALRAVAAGDLEPRVTFTSRDELGALGRTFNAAMLELARSRAKVEFLRHMGEWQKVARRLAHEIRNPLTPIQLAVQECARRYDGSDPAFARLLATTSEVVEEEVGSLRRLVGRFARFARLPDAELSPCDLTELLREQASHFALGEGGSTTTIDDDEGALVGLDLDFEIPDRRLPALIDREMFHRALLNLVRNAAQSIRDARTTSGDRPTGGRVRVRAGQDGEGLWVAVDDDGPGIPGEVRTSLFDPYVTTKRDGTGLGLSIVKKIALDHGGRVEAGTSPEGGARLLIRLPRAEGAPVSGTAPSSAAATASSAG
jgi:two-component system nitrogen regulation sensor histidine kinase NtrY